jgi:hypothetical protein
MGHVLPCLQVANDESGLPRHTSGTFSKQPSYVEQLVIEAAEIGEPLSPRPATDVSAKQLEDGSPLKEAFANAHPPPDATEAEQPQDRQIEEVLAQPTANTFEAVNETAVVHIKPPNKEAPAPPMTTEQTYQSRLMQQLTAADEEDLTVYSAESVQLGGMGHAAEVQAALPTAAVAAAIPTSVQAAPAKIETFQVDQGTSGIDRRTSEMPLAATHPTPMQRPASLGPAWDETFKGRVLVQSACYGTSRLIHVFVAA